MDLKNLKIRARIAAGNVLHKVTALFGSQQSAQSERALELTKLEDRVLLSASPAAVMVDPGHVAEFDPSAVEETAELGAYRSDQVTGHDVTEETRSSVDFGDLVIDIDGILNDQSTEPTLVDEGPVPAFDESMTPQVDVRNEVIFVDTGVNDYQQLVEDLWNVNDASREVDVVLLSKNSDGIAQITAALSLRSEVDAVHFVSHGTNNAVKLGSTWITSDNLSEFRDQIGGWRSSLTEGADLLFYGCELGSTIEGQTLLKTISDLTGADLAASIDDTGNVVLGGDWDLEFRIGEVESAVAISESAQAGWQGLMQTFVVTNTNDSGTGSFRQAIIDANAQSGMDTIDFQISAPLIAGAHTIRPNSIYPEITDPVFIDASTVSAFTDSPVVEIDGTNAGFGTGIRFFNGSQGSTLQGLVINRFGQAGVALNNTSNVTLHGNYIGTDITGTLDRGNAEDGIVINAGASNNQIGGTAAGEENLISGNDNNGIYIDAFAGATSGNVIEGNLIGTDITGTQNLSNSQYGVLSILGSGLNTIGGTADGAGNTIAHNALGGILLNNNSSATIQRNLIYNNGGLSINLATLNAGIDANDTGDADLGDNLTQNSPVILGSKTDGSFVVIAGSLNSAANETFRLEFFHSENFNSASGSPYAEHYIGFAEVTTDRSGNASFAETFSASVSADALITATATDTNGNTSELATDGDRTIEIVSTVDLDANDSSGHTGNDFGRLYFAGDPAISIADTDVVITDSDSSTIARSTVVLSNAQDGASEILDADVTGTNITKSFDSSTGILQLVGDDTKANYVQVLESLSYENTAMSPSRGTREISVTVFDGQNESAAAHVQLKVKAVAGRAGTGVGYGLPDDAPELYIFHMDEVTVPMAETLQLSMQFDGEGMAYRAQTNKVYAFNNNDLFTIDVEDGTVSLVKENAVSSLVHGAEIYVDPGTGAETFYVLYNDEVETLDLDTGNLITSFGTAGTLEINRTTTVNAISTTISTFDSLAVDPLTGTVYVGDDNKSEGSDGARKNIDIYSLNLTTGGLTYVASSDADIDGEALSFADDGFAYTEDEGKNDKIYRISLLDGSLTPVAGIPGSGDVEGLAFNVGASVFAPTISLDADDSSGAGGTDYETSYSAGGSSVGVTDTDTSIASFVPGNYQYATMQLTNAQSGDSLSVASLPATVTATVQTNVPGQISVRIVAVDVVAGASAADFQSALESVSFDNSVDTPDATTRSIEVNVANMAGLESAVATSTISVSINVAPSVNLDSNNSSGAMGSDYSTSFSEGAAAVAIADTDIAIVDVDDTNIESAQIQLTNKQTNDELQIGALPNGISSSITVLATDITVTLSGSGTKADYEAAILAVSFSNSNEDPNTSPRNVTVSVNDGVVDSAIATTTISVSAVNDSPTLDLNGSADGTGYATTFTEGGSAVAIVDTDVAISDVDNGTIDSATITLTNKQTADELAVAALPAGIAFSIVENAGNIVVTLTGTATQADYQTALQAVTFDNSSENPDNTSRIITVVVNDGAANSTAATTTVAVNPVNDVPTLDLDGSADGTGYATTFTEGGSAVAILNTDVSIADVDNGTIDSATITLTNKQASDELAVAALPAGIAFSIVENAGNIVVTLTGTATQAAYQTALQAVTFDNSSENPDGTSRIITVVVNDGAANSAAATTTVAVSPVNDVPTLDLDGSADGTGYATTFTEGGSAVAILNTDVSIADVDNGSIDSATITLTNKKAADELAVAALPTGIAFSIVENAGNIVVTLTGTATQAAYQTALQAVTFDNSSENPDGTSRIITVVVNDGAANSAAATTTVAVSPVNDPPTIDLDASADGIGYATTFTEGGPAVAILNTDVSISDVDNGSIDSATITLTNKQASDELAVAALPTGIAFSIVENAGNIVVTLTGTATQADYQTALQAVTFDNSSENPDNTSRIRCRCKRTRPFGHHERECNLHARE
jgi:hypothetical protein